MKILTLNTWQERGPWQDRWEIIFKGIEKYQPDVIGFQEVFNKEWAREVGVRLGYPESVIPDEPSGLMFLSKFPVLDSASRTYRMQAPTEEYFRYALFAELKINQKRLGLFNTHLSWRLDEGKIRSAQIDELLSFIEEKCPKYEKAVMGDFNAPPKTAEVKKMTEEAGYTDIYDKVHPGQPGLTWDNRNIYASATQHPLPDRRIDYLFTHGQKYLLTHAETAEILYSEPNDQGIFASDHFGLMAEFREGA